MEVRSLKSTIIYFYAVLRITYSVEDKASGVFKRCNLRIILLFCTFLGFNFSFALFSFYLPLYQLLTERFTAITLTFNHVLFKLR